MGIRKKRHADESSHLLEKSEKSDDENKQRCFPLKRNDKLYDRYIRPLKAEFISTLILVFSGNMVVINGGSVMEAAVVHGLILVALVIVFLPISGGHVNPAITLGVALSGNMGAIQAIFYALAQVAGAITGSALVLLTTDSVAYSAAKGATPLLAPGVSILEGLFLEATLTFILVLVVLVCAVDNESPLSPIAIGLTLLVGILAGGPLTGGSLNPARALGPAVIYSKEETSHWDDHWVYWVAPILGSLVAAVIFRFILASPKNRTIGRKEPPEEDPEHHKE